MKVAVVLPDSKNTGVWYYSSQLYKFLPMRKEFIYVQNTSVKLSSLYYLNKVLKTDAEIFHIQLEPRFFRKILENLFLPFIVYIIKRVLKRRLIVTMHALINYADMSKLLKDDRLVSRFSTLLSGITFYTYLIVNKVILSLADSIVFHNRVVLDEAIRLFKINPRKAKIIPHGSTIHMRTHYIDRVNGMDILCFGFLRAIRDMSVIIEAFDRLRDDLPEARLHFLLIVPLDRYNDIVNIKKFFKLLREVRSREKIHLLINPPEDMIREYLEKACIGILPHQERTLESSGVAWRFAGLGIPFIGRAIPKLVSEFGRLRNELLLSQFTPENIASTVKKLLTDRKYYEQVSNLLLDLACERSWKKVSEMHLELYRELIHEGCNDSNTL